MMRKEIVHKHGGFDVNYIHCEDYELWVRISRSGKLANLTDTLMQLRIHLNQDSQKHREIQKKNSDRVSQEAIGQFLDKDISLDQARFIRNHHFLTKWEDTYNTAILLFELYKQYITNTHLSNLELQQIRSDASKRMSELVYLGTKQNPIKSLILWGLLLRITPFNTYPAIGRGFNYLRRLTSKR